MKKYDEMKKMFTLISIAIIAVTNSYGQDVITKKTGDEIRAKVSEVGQTEIKYKNFDSLEGPTVAILKADIFMIKYENGTKDVFTDTQVTKPEAAKPGNENSTVYFMRSTGFAGSAAAFTAFIDDSLVCRLNNKRFSLHTIQPGDHKFTVQFAGKKSKSGAEPIKIKIEPGKTYYIQFIFQTGMLVNNLYCQEVTESSAQLIMPALKEDTDCF
jgi:hypothetical protein